MPSDKVESLSRSFAGRLRERYDELEEALTAFEHEGSASHLEGLVRLAHNLAGASGGYGFGEVGRLSRSLELAATGAVEEGTTDVRRLWRILGALRRAVQDAELKAVPTTADLRSLDRSEPGRQAVHLVEDDFDFAALLGEQLAPYGYDVVHHATAEAVLEAVEKDAPAALMIDVNLADGVRGPAIVERLPAELRERVPVLFVSVDGGLDARLQAVRVGAAAYLTKPLDVDDLVDVLDHLVRDTSVEQQRVLIVDDSEEDARLYSATLEEVGMVTRVATDPSQALRLVHEFGPEIILLDLYMPEIRGDELASVIRQDPALLSIPIVFVSAEADQRLQMEALRRGADDFLLKPLDPHRLVSSVRIRAHRYRQLRASMQRDSLTGLLNHRNVKESLETETKRSRRAGSPLSVAMIDIDRFKSVNDTHGHPVGDRVIKSLARVLVQRLRRSDIVGRYGGEEFLLIMPDTPAESAAIVLEELRTAFSLLTYRSGDRTFSCSLSGGLVELRPDETSSEVLARVDKALYAAKQQGRNLVVTAG